jgi:hypothetical protein
MRLWKWVVVRDRRVRALLERVEGALALHAYCLAEDDPRWCDPEALAGELADALIDAARELRRWMEP